MIATLVRAPIIPYPFEREYVMLTSLKKIKTVQKLKKKMTSRKLYD